MKNAQKFFQHIVDRKYNFPKTLFSSDMQKLFAFEETMNSLENQFGVIFSII